jgi:hypothetical protein
MPRYRFILPIRAIGGYRLPEAGFTSDGIALTPTIGPACTAQIDVLQAVNAEQAYVTAQQHVEHLFGYLALLGDGAAFILDGREGTRASNLDLKENPVPADQPPPLFESIGGVITVDGQDAIAALVDPDGSKRRSGAVVVHNAQGTIVPGQERLTEICELFFHRAGVPPRVRIALDILHDAACAREPTSGFTQTHTALEVLTDNRRPPTLLDVFFREASTDGITDRLTFKSKRSLLDALRSFFADASLSQGQIERIVNHVASTQSVSQVDTFCDYLNELGVAVNRSEASNWRKIRGALVHTSEVGDQEQLAMRQFRNAVRAAVSEELRRAAQGRQG